MERGREGGENVATQAENSASINYRGRERERERERESELVIKAVVDHNLIL